VSKKTIPFSILLFFFTILCLGNYANGKKNNEIDETKHISKSILFPKSQTSHQSQTNIEQTHNKNEPSYTEKVKANSDIFNPVDYCSFKGYKDSGSFVEAPAHVGDWTGYIIGVFPAIIITEPFRLVPIYGYEGDNIGEYTLYGTTKTFGSLFGGPSFVLKRIFWDTPIWIYSSIFENQHASKPSIEHKKRLIKPVTEKKTEEIKPAIIHKWQLEQGRHSEVESISAKPLMLEKSGIEVKEEKPVIKKPSEQVSIIKEQSFYDKSSIEGGTTKYDETSWTSPPPLPDWVNKEMNKK
jgi:hypothetical protein